MLLYLILFLVISILMVLLILYKMEIRSVGKQLKFINNHDTNKFITLKTGFKDIFTLSEELNQLIDIYNKSTSQNVINDKELKETITNISHDIRTPLTSLSGYFQLLIDSDSEEERERYIRIIETRINSLRNLLEDMFVYMKVQNQNYEVQKEKYFINKILRDQLFSYYDDFNNKKIEPEINISDDHLFLYSYPIALDRIINNLISNSLIYGKDYIGISLYESCGYIHIVFENDFENEMDIEIEHVFNRFYKNDKSRTLNSSGLGLTIVKELVESMGGQISAEIKEEIFSVKIKFRNMKK